MFRTSFELKQVNNKLDRFEKIIENRFDLANKEIELLQDIIKRLDLQLTYVKNADEKKNEAYLDHLKQELLKFGYEACLNEVVED